MVSTRRRTGYMLLVVILGHIILISSQAGSTSAAGTLESFTFGVFSEIQRSLSSVLGGLRGMWGGYIDLRNVEIENQVFKEEIDQLQVQLQHQRAIAEGTQDLQSLLDLQTETDLPTVSARVIAADATPWFRTLTIDRGSQDGLRKDLAVIAPTGVVGRIMETPGSRAAKVQLLIDRNAAAGALLTRTGAVGVVTGNGNDGNLSLSMEYVSNLEDVQYGDVVVTSGIEGIYPRRFVIGHVDRVEEGSGLYKIIRVKPVVYFPGLSHVLVVMTESPPGSMVVGTE